MKKVFSVTEECIGCKACTQIAPDNFKMKDDKAYVYKQPETEEELKKSKEALEKCPVEAIKLYEEEEPKEPVLAKSNVKEVLDKYPHLKEVLYSLSPRFKRLENPVMYNTLARFATFKDAARIGGVSLCELLHALNRALGTYEKLLELAPECISEDIKDEDFVGEEITWQESADRYIYNEKTLEDLIQKIQKLKPGESIVIIGIEKPIELLKIAKELGFKFNITFNQREYRVSIYNPKPKEEKKSWIERKHEFDVLDVRTMKQDPFDTIIKKAYETEEDDGFILIQRFEPFPMIKMLNEMGFESIVEHKGPWEVWVYFYKKPQPKDVGISLSQKPEVVIQSATPVAYPVMMRLLQSDDVRKTFKIKELKVWEETEKHLGWIISGRADISFSALLVSTRLKSVAIKIPSLFVWDNFYLLVRGEGITDISQLKGKTIYMPLFEEAPPAKITRFLIRAKGLNPDDFSFAYGEPFGRPEKIYKDFVAGRIEACVLREPEASYAIKTAEKLGVPISVISYNKMWNEVYEGFGSFPNAGVFIKEDLVKKYPEEIKLFLDELKNSIDWVNNNRKEAAKLSFDLMRQPIENVELFLERVKFEYVSGEELVKKVENYFSILIENKILDTEIDDEFLNKFKLDI